MSTKENKRIPRDSKFSALNPLLSQEGLLLVRGRLQESEMQFSIRHPIMIPSKHKLSGLIVRDAHEKVLQAGISDTLVQVCEKFWFLEESNLLNQS